MAYGSDIDSNLSPDHRYSFDGDVVDTPGTLDGTNVGCILTDSGICMDTTNCLTSNAVADQVTLPTTGDIHTAATEKCAFGWLAVTAVQQPFCNIYGEGNTTQAFRIIIGMGNNVTFEVDDAAKIFQIFGDNPLALDRVYHLYLDYSGTGFDSEVRAFVDGVLQATALNDDTTVTATTLPARVTPRFSAPGYDPGMGGETLKMVGGNEFKFNEWCLSNEIFTATQIREDLFEKGALPDLTITDQSGLTAVADSVRADAPCCIRVTGSGTINLSADNVKFSPLASIHVQYTGTGTLNWTNTNGSDASIGSVTAGGTINFINPSTLTINGCINGCEVRIYDDETPGGASFDTELDGIEVLSGTSFDFEHPGTTNTVIIQMLAVGYEEVLLSYTVGSANQSVTLFPKVELNQ